jgi:hypothetical protein
MGKSQVTRPLGSRRRRWKDLEEEDGLDRSGSGAGQVAGACGCDNEHSGSTKCGEFLD